MPGFRSICFTVLCASAVFISSTFLLYLSYFVSVYYNMSQQNYEIMTYSSLHSQHLAWYLANSRHMIIVWRRRNKRKNREREGKNGRLEKKEGWKTESIKEGKEGKPAMIIFIAVVNDCRQILFLKSPRKEYHIIFPNNISQE